VPVGTVVDPLPATRRCQGEAENKATVGLACSEDEHEQPDHDQKADQKDDADYAAKELENACHGLPRTLVHCLVIRSLCSSMLFPRTARRPVYRPERRVGATEATEAGASRRLSPHAAKNSGSNATAPKTPMRDSPHAHLPMGALRHG
jgi:hypothetical protein